MKSYVVEQKITPLVNRYLVYEADDAGAKAGLVCFVQQKRFAFKESIDFFTDESATSLAFKVKAEKVLDVHGKFLVTDPNGNRLGAVRKVFGASLFRSTWEVLGQDDQPVMTVQERSKKLAIIRRLWAVLPYIGDLPFFMKFHFDFLRTGDKTVVATHTKTTLIRDHYLLTINDDALLATIGWQTFVAQAVLLDALQDR